jgi:hypothetical protein
MAARVTEMSIRVYPLVKKFLAYHYDIAPFPVASLGNPYATYLHAQLDRRDHRDSCDLPKKYNKLTDKLTIGVGEWRGRMFGSHSISAYRVAAFNDFARQMFFDKLTVEVSIRTSLGEGLKAAMQGFLDRYEITEDELPIKTAIEYYYRTLRKQTKGETAHSTPGRPRRTAIAPVRTLTPDASQSPLLQAA